MPPFFLVVFVPLSVRSLQSEGRKWGVGSVVVGFGVFGPPIFSPEVPKYHS